MKHGCVHRCTAIESFLRESCVQGAGAWGLSLKCPSPELGCGLDQAGPARPRATQF